MAKEDIKAVEEEAEEAENNPEGGAEMKKSNNYTCSTFLCSIWCFICSAVNLQTMNIIKNLLNTREWRKRLLKQENMTNHMNML